MDHGAGSTGARGRRDVPISRKTNVKAAPLLAAVAAAWSSVANADGSHHAMCTRKPNRHNTIQGTSAAAAKAIAAEHIACARCGVKQPPTAFAKGQLRTNKSTATCLACTATSAAAKRVDTAQCAKCGLEKPKGEFGDAARECQMTSPDGTSRGQIWRGVRKRRA